MTKSNLRKALNYAGSVIALLSVLFVVHRINAYWSQVPDNTFTVTLLLLILLLAGVYGAANIILAAAWRLLMLGLEQTISARIATRIYGLTQLAKYVPGNIFQFAGRQFLAMSYGFSGKAIAKSAFLELLLLVLTGAGFVLWMLPLLYPAFSIVYGLSLFIITVLLVAWGLKWRGQSGLIKAVIRYFLFLLISGTVFLCVLYSIVDSWTLTLAQTLPLIGAYVIAWLAGLVTPGSPAGVGIREFLLILLLKPFFAEIDIVMAVILSRITTVVGDCFFYLYSLSLR
ncbi:hypothetical protein NB069_13110 [Leclercia adecarboxylata]|uniref:hypothetical protein n=1 Tax=Leclercia adecarboxylata TaxID=83655 RepID=UPI00202A6A63|nr:hypothetical protein [Leclercia adecarboxylata]URN97628.1 hypothetical protein NB069_13110 [Leclercia adecarboxylata]